MNEFILAAHTPQPLGLSLIDMSRLIDLFSSDYPDVEQLPTAPRVELNPGPPEITFGPMVDLPRILMRAKGSGFYVFVQADRFGVGWGRKVPPGEPADYPGYPAMKEKWSEYIRRFSDWYTRRSGDRLNTRLLELSYFNALPQYRADGTHMMLSELNRYVQRPLPRPVNAFQMSWAECLTDDLQGAKVNAFFGLGAINLTILAYAFNFNGLTPFEGSPADPGALDAIDKLHQRILEMRDAAITSEVHSSAI